MHSPAGSWVSPGCPSLDPTPMIRFWALNWLQEVRQSQHLWVVMPVCMADTVELQGISGWLRGHSNWEDLVLFPSPVLFETPTFWKPGASARF